MPRACQIKIDKNALINNLNIVNHYAPNSGIIAMVKANAYGNGLSIVASALEGKVSAFGVACLEEALMLKACGVASEIILFEGVFSQEEYQEVQAKKLTVVIHNHKQLNELLSMPLGKKQKISLKVDTGMHRLGFNPSEIMDIYHTVKSCKWVDESITVMTHFCCADELENPQTKEQMALFYKHLKGLNAPMSLANSAAIVAWPDAHADYVRPGIMLYGASPIATLDAFALGLKPVMNFYSDVIALRDISPNETVGYGSIWQAHRQTKIAVVACGYGDGYPRVIKDNTPVFINENFAPIVGRISMDMLTIDVTDLPGVQIGDKVELWGEHVAIDSVAKAANTTSYELMAKITARPQREVV
jgi:alanine racemase